MDKAEIEKVTEYFEKKYPNPVPALKFGSDYELLVAVILSAQCTDARVNMVTEKLFKVADTPRKMLDLGEKELQKYIYSCGFYRSKAGYIMETSRAIIEKFKGKVPSDFESLRSLPGVGRKTANVVASVAFHQDAIAVDTHVFRVANRIGLVKASTPEKTEEQLKKIIPREKWSKSHHYLIFHGRETCTARRPDCVHCGINRYCEFYRKQNGAAAENK